MSHARTSAGRLTAFVVGLIVSIPLGPVLAAGPDSGGQASPHAIRMSNATFRPGLGERPAIPPGLSIAGYAPEQRGYYIVQFDGPVRPEWKSAAEAAGAELLEYVPDFAFKARMSPEQASKVEALGDVVWVGLFQPAFKLRPRMLGAETDEPYRVRLHRGADASAARRQARDLGVRATDGEGQVFLARADARQLEALARILEVGWIERFSLAELHNEYAAGIIKADVAQTNGYDGSGQTIAIADTGIGAGTAAGAHPAISAGRITIFDWVGADDPLCWDVVDDGAHDPDSGHGTHVAVSAVGAGNTTGLGRGAAPGADLVFQAVENLAYFPGLLCLGAPPAYILTGIPYDIRELFQQAYDAGARVHSDSWGTTAYAGLYDIDSYFVDEFIWSNPDMTIAYSAGNSGEDWNWNGYVNIADPLEERYYVTTPATAKNLITVGASEGDREGHYECDPVSTAYCDGGMNEIFTYGWGWAVQFGGPAPIAADPTAGNKEQMAGFSSRGPTHDYRLKPDVVAPGTWILSGYSDMYQQYYDPAPDPVTNAWQSPGWFGPKDVEYKYAGGTSMATPIVAGGAAVVRQYYQARFGHNASAALVKATLINSADDLLDENNDGSDDNDIPIPNNHEGWGRINLDAATDGSHVFEDGSSGLQTGGNANYQYTVETGGSPFKVSLVWSDFPSSETAASNLVNDLDLQVMAPGGTTYKGNVFSGGWSQAGGSEDRINNVENVYVQSAAAGSWSVTVSGYNVPNGPQPFALVVDGGAGGGTPPSDDPPTVNITYPADGATVGGSFDITANAGDDNGVDKVEFFVDSSSIGADTDGTDGWSVALDSTALSDGGHTISATATDTTSQTANDSIGVTVDNSAPPPAGTVHVSDLDGTGVDAGRGRWTATVTIAVSLDAAGPAAGALVEGAWGGGATGGGSCTTDAGGTCQVSKDVRNKFPEASFTVSDVTYSGSTYDAGANADPDGDSDGTTIVVAKDGGSEPPPAGPAMHVGDLDGSSVSAPRNRWSATVDIEVHDEFDAPLAGMTVEGSWSTGGGGTCTTAGDGRCTVNRSNIKGNNASTTFSVTGLTDPGAGYVYHPGADHDPDGDSSGSAISIARP